MNLYYPIYHHICSSVYLNLCGVGSPGRPGLLCLLGVVGLGVRVVDPPPVPTGKLENNENCGVPFPPVLPPPPVVEEVGGIKELRSCKDFLRSS